MTAGAPGVQVRAGFYAEWDGRKYWCVVPPRSGPEHGEWFDARTGTVHLRVSGAEPRPPGFDEDRWGEWSAFVHRDRVTRLTFVRTTAVYVGDALPGDVSRGERVVVLHVQGGDRALVDRGPWPLDDATGDERRDRTSQETWVPVGSLVGVVEEITEIPL